MSEEKRRRITIGILAHVDAGKTTLSEGVLFRCGNIRRMGRVDHGDAFLDTDAQEKQRGITIYSKQAEIRLPDLDITLLDTPGHVDFSAEMERTLQVLDYAILVINGREGVQGHALTLWKLLKRYNVPAFAFINKMDLCARDGDLGQAKAKLLSDLRQFLSDACIDFSGDTAGSRDEEIAMRDEAALEEYLQSGSVAKAAVAEAIAAGRIVPCYFGSALKMEGIDELLAGLNEYCRMPAADPEGPIRARVFKITRDEQGERLTHLKVLSGCLKPKMSVDTGTGEEEKVHQIRIYSGDKYILAEEAGAGRVCTVTGLKGTFAGQLLPYGWEYPSASQDNAPELEAVLSYGICLPEGVNAFDTYKKFKELEEEDPQLKITWDERAQEIQIRLMGQVQLEILQTVIRDRFGIDVAFGEGRIAYRETIGKAICGAGHFEPLRHYAEVHMLLQPLPEGSGLMLDSACSEDDLDKNWQRLIFTHLTEREHLGTLIGAPITDMKITLLAGRAHLKHTEGGDFRQATYRALRQGLRKSLADGQMKLLEPWYAFSLQIPQGMVGRAMSDIQKMGGSFDQTDGEILTGYAPVSEMKDYAAEVASYTRGFGHLTCRFCGYRECHNTEKVVAASGYDADRDMSNPADSVFCSHGAGHNVAWDEADEQMHVSPDWSPEKETAEAAPAPVTAGGAGSRSRADDKELDAIFERTYGTKRREKEKRPVIEARVIKAEPRKKAPQEPLPKYLFVDGYNIIFAWDELKELARVNIDSAREALLEILSNYQGFQDGNMIVVFDAYKVKGGERHVEKKDNLTVVYTKEAETADTYIERTAYELSGKKYDVRVATSDRLEQMIIIGNNARKVSADDFRKEVEQVNDAINRWIEAHNRKNQIEHPNKINIGKGESQ
ncbi:MAG: TetM/TetW/TetO/TetS family tetracycline resistance ribosomal protection protein [Firmicutes bacterium]|nr:TetM/TetW/TetO/TetS family tetracycline resistance ribosomal protection protein [Bacillota bacterium]